MMKYGPSANHFGWWSVSTFGAGVCRPLSARITCLSVKRSTNKLDRCANNDGQKPSYRPESASLAESAFLAASSWC